MGPWRPTLAYVARRGWCSWYNLAHRPPHTIHLVHGAKTLNTTVVDQWFSVRVLQDPRVSQDPSQGCRSAQPLFQKGSDCSFSYPALGASAYCRQAVPAAAPPPPSTSCPSRSCSALCMQMDGCIAANKKHQLDLNAAKSRFLGLKPSVYFSKAEIPWQGNGLFEPDVSLVTWYIWFLGFATKRLNIN